MYMSPQQLHEKLRLEERVAMLLEEYRLLSVEELEYKHTTYTIHYRASMDASSKQNYKDHMVAIERALAALNPEN